MQQLKCKDLVEEKFKDTIDEVRGMYKAGDYEALSEYALSLDYVKAGTFSNQRAGYLRWQLSWGGPSDEFRIYDNGDVEYWYLDWWDGACVDVDGDDAEIIKNFTGWYERGDRV